MEARSNPLPAEKSLQGDRTLVLQDRLVPACRVLSFRSQAAPEGNTLQRKGSLMEYSFKSKQVALTFAEFTGTMKGPMTMADCKVIAPTNKSFKVDFCTVAHWNENGAIVEENLFYDLIGMLKQIGVMSQPRRVVEIPQREGWASIRDHFAQANAAREVGVVLPVGCGKSGLICIAPFGVRARRVLVIAPGTRIRASLGSPDEKEKSVR